MSAAVGFGCWLRQKNTPHGFCHSACSNLLQRLLQNCWALHHLPNGWSFGSAWLLHPYSPWQQWFTTNHDSRIVIVHSQWYASRIHSIPRKQQKTAKSPAISQLRLPYNWQMFMRRSWEFSISSHNWARVWKLRRSKWRRRAWRSLMMGQFSALGWSEYILRIS